MTRAKQAGIPVISYGRLVSDADLDYYVSIDPKKVGEQQGQALLDALKKEGKPTGPVVAIHGSPTDSNAPPYKQGAHSVLDKAGVKFAKEFDTPDWSPDKAQTEMEQAITGVGKNGFAGVYVANDGMASGAIAAMKGASIAPSSRPVTGQDAEVAGLQRILAGEQLMTVYQPIKKIAAASAELAVPLARGEKPPGIATAKTDNGKEQVPSVLHRHRRGHEGQHRRHRDQGRLREARAALHRQVRAGLPDGRDLLAPHAGRARGRPPRARGRPPRRPGRRSLMGAGGRSARSRARSGARRRRRTRPPARSRAACRRASPSPSPPTAAPPSRPAGSAGRCSRT